MPIEVTCTRELSKDFQPAINGNIQAVFLVKDSDLSSLGVVRHGKQDYVIARQNNNGLPSVAAYIEDGDAKVQLSANGKLNMTFTASVKDVVLALIASGHKPLLR